MALLRTVFFEDALQILSSNEETAPLFSCGSIEMLTNLMQLMKESLEFARQIGIASVQTMAEATHENIDLGADLTERLIAILPTCQIFAQNFEKAEKKLMRFLL